MDVWIAVLTAAPYSSSFFCLVLYLLLHLRNRCKNSNIFSIIGSNHKKTDKSHSFLSRFASTIRNSYSIFFSFHIHPKSSRCKEFVKYLVSCLGFLVCWHRGDVLMCDVVFGCKSTKSLRNLFARLFNYISSIVNPIWQTSYFASFLLMVDTLPANSEELSFFR